MSTSVVTKFTGFSDLYDIDKKLHDQYWKDYKKISIKTVVRKLRAKQNEFKKFSKDRCGLNFSKIDIKISGRENNLIRITLSDIGKQALGFFGKYIDALTYVFYSDGARATEYNPTTREFRMWFNIRLSYTLKSGGGNGVSEEKKHTSISLWYNITHDSLEVIEEDF